MESKTIQYPRFIQNRPCGEDKYKGNSQERLAKTIAEHIKNNDSIADEEQIPPRIIGLQGEWGSGKSNVIKILEKELAEKYHFFEYDAWGHQEDLQRRAFLETLTSKLILDKYLDEDKESTPSVVVPSTKVSWNKKLEELLARYRITDIKSIPILNGGTFWAFLFLALTPITTFISEQIVEGFSLWFKILTAFSPIVLGLVVWAIACIFNKDARHLGYLLQISKQESSHTKNYETINEDEPTVSKFKKWMQDLSEYIDNENKNKLIIIYDNMDRLPDDKVKDLWSSIHTFFAEEGFKNIWVIIPYDETHLACAFGQDKENAKELTTFFINKTFPIVYRVAPPVIIDFKDFVEKLYTEAFGYTENESKEFIIRLFRLLKPKATARDIITFFNAMVALKLERKDEISLENIALFCIKKNEILAYPVNQILSGDYMEQIKQIYENDIRVQREMSALVYGIDVEQARQIPLTRYIENCINKEPKCDINEYATSNINFDKILKEVIENFDDVLIDKVIICLDSLTKKNSDIDAIWNDIAKRKYKVKLLNQEFSNEYRILLSHCPTKQQDILDKLYTYLYDFSDFNGVHYFNALEAISVFISDTKLNYTLILKDKTVSSEIFIDYVRAGKEKYSQYKVNTNAKEFEDYLINKLSLNEFTFEDIIGLLCKDKKYSFENLYLEIENYIKNHKVESSNFKSIFSTYKTLSIEKPLKVQLDDSQTNKIMIEMNSLNQNTIDTGYSDIVAMRISKGVNIPISDERIISEIGDCMNYYAKYGELLLNNLSWNIPLLNFVLKYMTENGIGEDLNIVKILPQYENIKNKIAVTDEYLIKQLNKWANNITDNITAENIASVVSSSFYKITAQFDNDLTRQINNIAIDALLKIEADTLYNKRKDYYSDYWHVIINSLIDNKCFNSLPDNVSDFGKKILKDIATGAQSTQPLPQYYNSIINKLDKAKVGTCITEIRDLFCNSQTSMTTEKFLFFESLLRMYGLLDKRKEEVSNKILCPIIVNDKCRNVILENSDYYINIINNAGDYSNELRKSVSGILQKDSDEQLLKFAIGIGIKVKNEEDEK